MSVLTIHHQTIYRYRTPMAFGPHRLMLRPRESHALRLCQHELAITPPAFVTWAHDVAGNSVATASFSEPSDTLTIDSAATLSIDVDRWPVFDIAASAQRFPFLLSEDEMTDLGALRLQAYLDSAGRVREWAQSFVAGAGTDTLSLLKDISAGVAAQIAYETREDEGAQSPDETLARRSGSCRDFAVLFVDALKEQDKRFEYKWYAKEGHGNRKMENRIDEWQRIEAFLSETGYKMSADLKQAFAKEQAKGFNLLAVEVDTNMIEIGAKERAQLGGKRILAPAKPASHRRRQRYLLEEDAVQIGLVLMLTLATICSRRSPAVRA